MASNIRIKRSAVPDKVPSTSDLALGELAVNTYDGKLYIKQDTTSTGGQETVVALGQRGYTGSQGSIGYTGSKGADGTSITILGTLTNTSELPVSSNTSGDGYIISGDLYVWDGVQWNNVGAFQGPTGYTGSQGSIGYTGSAGTNGYTGSKGDLGYTGSTGYVGSAGQIDVVASTPPSSPSVGDIWFDSASIKTYVYYDSYWVEVGSSEIGTLYNRADFNTSTSSIAPNASQNIDLPAFKSYVLLRVYTSAACWLRIYSDSAARTSDQSRTIGTDPVAGSGVIAEIITDGPATQKITPFIFGGNLESLPTTDVFLRATNLAGTTTSINIQLTLIRLEI